MASVSESQGLVARRLCQGESLRLSEKLEPNPPLVCVSGARPLVANMELLVSVVWASVLN